MSMGRHFPRAGLVLYSSPAGPTQLVGQGGLSDDIVTVSDLSVSVCRHQRLYVNYIVLHSRYTYTYLI